MRSPAAYFESESIGRIAVCLTMSISLLTLPASSASGANGASTGTATMAAPTFGLVAVKSRKTHGNAGAFDLAIDMNQPIGGNITVEPRAIGAGHLIVFQFSGPVVTPGTVSVSPKGTANVAFSGNEVLVTLSSLPDIQRTTVALANVNGSVSPPPVSVSFLIGDVNNSGAVNSADISAIKVRAGELATSANFRFDLNASGEISVRDIGLAKERAGRALPFEPVSILAVGDIAQCNGLPASSSAAALTATLIDAQAPLTPLILLGDLAYYSGTAEEFQNCYDPTYGKFKERSYPAPGNHDYVLADGAAYYNYFGMRAGPDRRGYYSVDIGSWHIISLNSNIDMTSGSAQETWLRTDLTANANKKCTLAYWHHPRFSSSNAHGNDVRSQDIWRALFEFKADVVLVGHDHTYERFAPQDPDGNLNVATGIRQFVIGTGGAALYGFGPAQPNSVVRGAGSFGVAKFMLGDGKYSWEFLPAEGSSFTDRGEGLCVH